MSFILKADDNLPPIYADSASLWKRFSYNLILNAYEAMPRGGRLKVTLKKLPSAVSVSVADTGVGIRSEDLAEIFNPFVTSKTTGAGMGLCKVYLLVEEHRGIVNVTSVPNKGTTFEVLLPVERLMTGLLPWEAASPRMVPQIGLPSDSPARKKRYDRKLILRASAIRDENYSGERHATPDLNSLDRFFQFCGQCGCRAQQRRIYLFESTRMAIRSLPIGPRVRAGYST